MARGEWTFLCHLVFRSVFDSAFRSVFDSAFRSVFDSTFGLLANSALDSVKAWYRQGLDSKPLMIPALVLPRQTLECCIRSVKFYRHINTPRLFSWALNFLSRSAPEILFI